MKSFLHRLATSIRTRPLLWIAALVVVPGVLLALLAYLYPSVPIMRGTTPAQAKARLAAAGLQSRPAERHSALAIGTVAGTDPRGGSRAYRFGEPVAVQVSVGTASKGHARADLQFEQRCLTECHTQQDCLACHQREAKKPASHDAKWLTAAEHGKRSRERDAYCQLCHDADFGYLTDSPFCLSCHQVRLPHEGEAGSEWHRTAGKQTAVCRKCHSASWCDTQCHAEIRKRKAEEASSAAETAEREAAARQQAEEQARLAAELQASGPGTTSVAWTFTAGGTVTLTGPTDVGGLHKIVDWTWTFGDGTSAEGRTVTHAWAKAGSYKLVLTMTDIMGRKQTREQTVRVR